ncbi:MAG: UDP-3-O-[3-hydroxymyristoyl] N-acetylglucosamine deacetylase [Cryomorphaceae bacterium]|jgi:UDP-3-O-[3-hydroxymyristoyl] N-acetylglucosamine deacetylase/3-hydroxyacyl-[acyl-carrier-protein] dehydratase
MSTKQKTLAGKLEFKGIGLHTGGQVEMTIYPAPDNHGYVFKRVDLEGHPTIKADLDHVVSTNRGTTIGKNGVLVNTTEHVLAALYGSEVDNALIELNGIEVPIMDGSAKDFVEGIQRVGIVDQEAEKDYFTLKENLYYEDEKGYVEMLAVPTPGNEFRITVMVDYNSPVLGTQHASMYEIGEFQKEIASCRTFVFLKELEFLAKNNLIKGGDLSNAIVLVEKERSQEEYQEIARMLGKEDLDVKVEGIGVLNTVKLQFENEPARHKLLDIVGDLALVGKPIQGHILAARPGHAGNVSFGKIIKNLIKEEKKKGPDFDLTKTPVYDVNQIMGILPHRYPFLLIDKILELDENAIVGVKNVTINEPFFQGHFPGNPVMPGVLQIEAMAQAGGVLALHNVEEPERWSTYFMKIDAVKFKRKVGPGDTVVFHLKLTSPIRRGIVQMKGTAYVNGLVVSEGELMAQIIKDK